MPKKNEAPGKRRFSAKVTRKQFLKKAGLAAGAVAAAGLGLSRTARAQSPQPSSQYQLPVTPNPDKIHIKKPGFSPADGEAGAADGTESELWVYPVGTSERQTLLQAGREQDPRISVVDYENSDFSTFHLVPLSENPDLPAGAEWDPRRRTPDSMNAEWAANNVAKKADGSPGTVLLKHDPATPFDFGTVFDPALDTPPGTGAIICNDCVISGEVDASGNPSTAIVNGTGYFIANWWAAAQYGAGVQVWHDWSTSFSVRNIVLKNPSYPGIIGYSGLDFSRDFEPHILGYMEVDNVRIYDMLPTPASVIAPGIPANIALLFHNDYGAGVVRNCYIRVRNSPDQGEPGFIGDFMQGIVSAPSLSGGTDENGRFFDAPSGPSMIIENNIIDADSSHLGSAGICIAAGPGAEIRDNTVKADIAIYTGETGWNGGGSVKIENNKCTARVAGFSCINAVGNQIQMIDGSTLTHPGIVLGISGNSVRLDASGSIDFIHGGLVAGFIGQDAFLLGNPFNSMKNAHVADNKFTGSADFGVFAGDFWDIPGTASGNVFIKNDFKPLSLRVAAVYLGSSTKDNVFGPNGYPPGGATKWVADDGSNNRIVGLPADSVASPGIGKAIKELVSRSKSAKGKYQAKIPKNWGFGSRKKRK